MIKTQRETLTWGSEGINTDVICIVDIKNDISYITNWSTVTVVTTCRTRNTVVTTWFS